MVCHYLEKFCVAKRVLVLVIGVAELSLYRYWRAVVELVCTAWKVLDHLMASKCEKLPERSSWVRLEIKADH